MDSTRDWDTHKASVEGSPETPESRRDPDEDNVAAIRQGGKAILGKALYSANNAIRFSSEEEKERHERSEVEEREARELMHLAEWNTQVTTVGGVEMTNEDAQKARRHIIDNGDSYAKRAVREGRIRADEQDDYQRVTRRIRDLEEKRGRGTISGEEDRECRELKRSRLGQVTEADAGRYHREKYGFEVTRDADAARSSDMRRDTTSAVPDSTLFQSAPPVGDAFAKASDETTTPEKTPAPLAPKVAATGLAI